MTRLASQCARGKRSRLVQTACHRSSERNACIAARVCGTAPLRLTANGGILSSALVRAVFIPRRISGATRTWTTKGCFYGKWLIDRGLRRYRSRSAADTRTHRKCVSTNTQERDAASRGARSVGSKRTLRGCEPGKQEAWKQGLARFTGTEGQAAASDDDR